MKKEKQEKVERKRVRKKKSEERREGNRIGFAWK